MFCLVYRLTVCVICRFFRFCYVIRLLSRKNVNKYLSQSVLRRNEQHSPSDPSAACICERNKGCCATLARFTVSVLFALERRKSIRVQLIVCYTTVSSGISEC